MSTRLVVIDADASIIEAIHLMKENNIRRLPVVSKGKIAGVLTEKMLKDYTPSVATSLDTWEVHYLLSKTPVSEAMNPTPHRITPDTDLADAAKLLHDRKLNGVLVMEGETLVGLFTTTDALQALLDICHEPNLVCGH
jgi:acetoin utilization protein AcuB